jgi:hypothetical protein
MDSNVRKYENKMKMKFFNDISSGVKRLFGNRWVVFIIIAGLYHAKY